MDGMNLQKMMFRTVGLHGQIKSTLMRLGQEFSSNSLNINLSGLIAT